MLRIRLLGVAVFLLLMALPAYAQSHYAFLWQADGQFHEGGHHNFGMMVTGSSGGTFKLCFSGSATPGSDFTLHKRNHRQLKLDGANCHRFRFRNFGWNFVLKAKRDKASEGSESITITLSCDPSCSSQGYTLLPGYQTGSVQLHG